MSQNCSTAVITTKRPEAALELLNRRSSDAKYLYCLFVALSLLTGLAIRV